MTSRWCSEAGDVANGIIAGHAIAERILAARSGHGGTEFDGACCANDFAAFGVIRGLADRGLRVPQDVKVIGFDGVTSGSYTTPALSTIQVDFAACEILGRYAVRTYRSWNRRGVAAKTGHHRLPAGGPGIDRGLRITPRWQAIRHRQQPSRPIPLNRNHSIHGINRHHSKSLEHREHRHLRPICSCIFIGEERNPTDEQL